MPGVQNNKSITIAILNRKENHSHIVTSHLLRFICAQIHKNPPGLLVQWSAHL